LYCDVESKLKNYHTILSLDSFFPKLEMSYMRALCEKMEERKRMWDAAGWPWGWERMLSFEGGGSRSRILEALDLSLDRILCMNEYIQSF
jgi:hypothetical protein